MSTSARSSGRARRKKAASGALSLTLLNRCGEKVPPARSFKACLERALRRNAPGVFSARPVADAPKPLWRRRARRARGARNLCSDTLRPGSPELAGLALDASRGYALTLTVTDDEEMSRLARRFLGKRTPTDVLAFEDGGPADAAGGVHLGDVVISRDRAEEEARERGVAVEDELRLYALHGLLHILGYRDDTAARRARMFREQRAILGDSAGRLD